MTQRKSGAKARAAGSTKAVAERDVRADDIVAAMRKIRDYAKPYQALLVRSEQGEHLVRMIEGLTSNLERKSVEPVAVMLGLPRRGLQRFVGESAWDHEPLRDQLLAEVSKEIGVDDGTVIIDGSGTPKKGTNTVGVARQWCGRLGKTDNCVIGVYAAYVGKSELATLVGAELFLPAKWAEDPERREATYVPEEITYRTQPEIARQLVEMLAKKRLPFQWVLADDEFGRTRAFRDSIAALGKSYVVDVPENTVVRRVRKSGVVRKKSWEAKALAARVPVSDWTYFHVRDGEKRRIEVRATSLSIATHRDDNTWVPEILLVIETTDGTQRWYCLARSSKEVVPLRELVRRAGMRHRVEEVFSEAKGEVGLDHFEVRAWHGWYHHATLCQMAHWFLVREKRRMGKKRRARHHQPDPGGTRTAVLAITQSEPRSLLRELPSSSERRRPPSPLRRPPPSWPTRPAPPDVVRGGTDHVGQ